MDTSLPKICRLRATPVNVPLARPHPTASGVVSSAPLVLMDLETDQGLTGHAYVFCYTPIVLKPIAELIEALQPLIQGDAVAPLVLAQKLQGRFRLLGPQGFTGIGGCRFTSFESSIPGTQRAAAGNFTAGALVGIPGLGDTHLRSDLWNSKTVLRFRRRKPAVDSCGTRTPLSATGFVSRAPPARKESL